MNDVATLMKVLDVSKAEALEIIASDKAIDGGADPYPLTAEQKKASKKARNVGRKTSTYNFNRKKKVNVDRQNLIAVLISALQDNGATDFKVTNQEREFTFELQNVKYKIALSAPRK